MKKIQFIKRSERQCPKVSLVLLDWSVRESFHLLHYLDKQDVPRDWFEVNIIEYYSHISEPLTEFESYVDNWVLLNMPESCYYHKHLMYNVGIALSAGEIVMIGDSDAMVRETFIRTIVDAFKDNPRIVFHIDQFRNTRRDLYPFCYPEYDVVLGEGCINNIDGQTTGVVNSTDPLHNRNYGSCMCAKREDLIAIGGADEHIDYLGHICGPYDMTFRLINNDLQEIWHLQEFMMHTWHPGQAGADNYLGPHDGRHMSTTALEALVSRRIMPFMENAAIKAIRDGGVLSEEEILSKLIAPRYMKEWQTENIEKNAPHVRCSKYYVPMGLYNGFRITSKINRLVACPIKGITIFSPENGNLIEDQYADSIEDLKAEIDRALPTQLIDSILKASNSAGRIVALDCIKGWVRGYLGFVYRALKFHDRASISDFLRKSLKLPIELFNLPAELKRKSRESKGELGSLAVALYFSSKSANNLTKPVALVDHWSHVRFLSDLSDMPGFSAFSVELVSGENSLKKALKKIEQEEHTNIIIWGNLYTKFHTLFATSSISNVLIVV